MAQVSALLKAPPTRCSEIIAGLVGGDMNNNFALEAASHKAAAVDLYDVWEEATHTPTSTVKTVERINWALHGRSARRLGKYF